MSIGSKKLIVSSYFNNLDWLIDIEIDHIIYDKTFAGGFIDAEGTTKASPSKAKELYPSLNIVDGEYNGYNISDYMTFIIDNYDNLPDICIFAKGNTFPRHVSSKKFYELIQNNYFTPIEDFKEHDPNGDGITDGTAVISCDGGWMELNDSWYLKQHKHPVKYFNAYNHFLKYVYKDPVLPKYVRFAPGGNYIVEKERIYKFPLNFYKNIKTFTTHHRVSGESHMIERALYTLWTSNFEINDNLNRLI